MDLNYISLFYEQTIYTLPWLNHHQAKFASHVAPRHPNSQRLSSYKTLQDAAQRPPDPLLLPLNWVKIGIEHVPSNSLVSACYSCPKSIGSYMDIYNQNEPWHTSLIGRDDPLLFVGCSLFRSSCRTGIIFRMVVPCSVFGSLWFPWDGALVPCWMCPPSSEK